MRSGHTADALPQHLRTTYRLLKSAFADEIDEEAYLPLLMLLAEKLSDRNLAEVIACAFGIDYEHALNDIYRARSTDAPSGEAVERIRQWLVPHGYEKWLHEE